MNKHQDQTMALIMIAHKGQVDKGGVNYWHHPVAVRDLLPEEATKEAQHAALLHDVLEDTPITLQDLRDAGYSEAIIDIVKLVSRTPEDGTYKEWIAKLANSGNRSAILVKIADITHNSDPNRLVNLSPEDRKNTESMIAKRYSWALKVLNEALEK